MISVSKALTIIGRKLSTLGSERVGIADSVGRILAEDIVADTDLPPFDRSQMDGFALLTADTAAAPVKLKIVGESAAGRGWHGTLKGGEAVRIMTGAPVPAGADAVQKVELTKESEGSVVILEHVKKETAIVRQAAEIRKGTTIFTACEVITENMIAALASFGYARLKVG